MAKRELRQKVKDLKEIIDLWVKFNNLIREVQTNKAATREQEDEFLNIKTSLARKQQVLSGTPLKVMNVLSQATSLSDIIKVPDLQARKFYTDWHETYLNLNELLGKLESGKIEPEVTKSVSGQKKRGCLYNFVLFIVFVVLVCIGFHMYDRKYDLKSRISGTVWGQKIIEGMDRFKAMKIFPASEGEAEKGEGNEPL